MDFQNHMVYELIRLKQTEAAGSAEFSVPERTNRKSVSALNHMMRTLSVLVLNCDRSSSDGFSLCSRFQVSESWFGCK